MLAVDDTKKYALPGAGNSFWPLLWLLLCSFAAPARSQEPPVVPVVTAVLGLETVPSATQQQQHDQRNQQPSGSVTGWVVDQSGSFIEGALVKLTREDQTAGHEITTDEKGQFFFADIAPGPFQVTVASEGLASQVYSGTVRAGETFVVPQITLVVATQVTEVRVGLTPVELAEVQIKEQEKQRVLGFIPNFYVSYVPNAVPLKPKQKFELAWKSAADPFTFLGVGGLAAVDQATNRWSGYGPGVEGYAKRYGATYANVFTGTFIGGAILPSLLKQDPRYFYRGTGSKRSRILYALAGAVICKGDNGKWQANYSSIFGNLAAGGISNLYYPASDRSGATLVFSNALIRLGEMAVANVFQEFIVPKLTPNLPTRAPAQP
jgi:hypothetical protein